MTREHPHSRLQLVYNGSSEGDQPPFLSGAGQFSPHTVYCSEGVSLVYFTGEVGKFQQMEIQIGAGCYQLWVVLKGGIALHYSESDQPFELLEGRCVLVLAGEEFSAGSLPGSSVDAMLISLSPELLEKVARGIDGFQGWEKLASHQQGYQIYLETKLGEVMLQIVRNLAFNEYEGCFKRHLVEMKVLEFLLLMLMQHREQEVDVSGEPSLMDEKALQQMHRAREILLSQLANPPSLRKLALEVGTNESHLKRHFKEAFQQTVYGFVMDKRMEKALALLKDKDLKIADISEQLGYKHATHFSAAFKKYFGGHPKDYR
ncbi:AraC family transcriptional regulator [Lunatimonas lonarensis]|uniref:AraC family transcriptional regulator n=1 Tax=Lunatimonas lonarensis TaxID=1232681 RepID=UPI000687F3C4|nr:AraC family transcriptional regulator [Lunatimonas lonarensis]